jgi:hypothetical protein
MRRCKIIILKLEINLNKIKILFYAKQGNVSSVLQGKSVNTA